MPGGKGAATTAAHVPEPLLCILQIHYYFALTWRVRNVFACLEGFFLLPLNDVDNRMERNRFSLRNFLGNAHFRGLRFECSCPATCMMFHD